MNISPNQRTWTVRDLPSQTGRTWLITGATNGVGRKVAQAASRTGARLVIPVRNTTKGASLAQQRGQHGSEVSMYHRDLADLSSVKNSTPNSTNLLMF